MEKKSGVFNQIKTEEHSDVPPDFSFSRSLILAEFDVIASHHRGTILSKVI